MKKPPEESSKKKILDLSSYKSIDFIVPRLGSNKLSVNVVNTVKNGKRLKLSKKLLEVLKNPKSIQVLTFNGKIYIGTNISSNLESFKFSQADDSVVYSARLVSGIAIALNLNFEKRSSVSLTNIRIKKAEYEGKTVTVAVIRANNSN